MIQGKKIFQNKQGKKKYFRNTSWLFAEKIARMISSLVVGIWVARYLGPENFGMFNYVMSLVGLFAVFTTLGIDGILVRDLVNREDRRDELIGTAFYLKLVAAVLVLVILGFFLGLSSGDRDVNLLIFIIASAPVFHSFDVIDSFFQSRVQSHFPVYAKLISLLVSSVLKMILIYVKAPLAAFAWVVLFDSVILASGFLYFYFHNNLSMGSWRFEKKTAKDLLKESWPLMISGAFITIYMKIDQIMIMDMLDSEAVGQYAAAVKLSEVWYFIPAVICTSVFPAVINAKKVSDALYYKRLQKLYDFMIWLAVAIALPVTFLSDEIVGFLYGEQYAQAGLVLMIHIWSGVFMFLLNSSGRWLIIEKLTRYALYRNLSGAVINVILNVFLIRQFGITGAAVATLISYAFAGLFFDFFTDRTRETFYMKLNALMFKSILSKR